MKKTSSVTSVYTDFALAIFSEVSEFSLIREALRIPGNVRDALFFKKVEKFIHEAGNVSDEERERFLLELEKTGKKEELGTALLLIIDRADEIAKPLYIGRIMAAHIRGEIGYDDALRLCYMISRSYTEDLKFLRGFSNGPQGDSKPLAESLASIGALSNDGLDGVRITQDSSGQINYSTNRLGDLLIKHALDTGS